MSALPLPPEIAAQMTTAAGLSLSLSRTRFVAGTGPVCLPTGCEGLDRLLGGGLQRGALVEMSGRAPSGRFSIALSALG